MKPRNPTVEEDDALTRNTTCRSPETGETPASSAHLPRCPAACTRGASAAQAPQVQPNEARTPPASESATNIGQFPGRCRQPRSPRRRNAMVNDVEASPEVPVQGEPGRKGEGDVPGPMNHAE
mmetsp:Transcript_88550/g.153732  ORF Transcript_88550/g.153732 Transcript_88550/m.153732 type:complete len:123 (+) Transcript_88550:739-1107(+)